MNARSARRHLAVTLLILLAFAFLEPAQAQIPEAEEAMVYGINATTPGEVFGTFSPPQVEEIYILAGRVSILSPRRTRVFFWPITKKYRAAWSQLNQELDGSLEIMRGGRVVKTISSEPYTVHFQAAGSTVGQLYVGEEAVAAEAGLSERREAYRKAMQAYAQADTERSAQPEQADEPEAPPVVDQFTVGLHEGFPVALESGAYQIRLRRPDGQIAPGSERTLRVFEARRSAMGYEVIPEERWTMPEQVNAKSDAILAKADSVIYLRPRRASEYPALAYERLKDTQYKGDASGADWIWMTEEPGERISSATLEIVRGDVITTRIDRGSFFVSQAYDQELGYRILPFDPATPETTPRVDFEAYRLELPPGPDSFVVRLSQANGRNYADSAREVRVLPVETYSLALSGTFFALALGLTTVVLRRRLARPCRG